MIRKANINDVKRIHELINNYAKQDLMLSRSLNELYENVRDFFVYEEKGAIYGCVALHVSWEDLAEIKSLVVEESRQKKGAGKSLLQNCIKEAEGLKIKRIFALTYKVDFFKKQGFNEIDKSTLPHKIWSECIHCPKFPDCDEKALIMDLS